MRPTILLTRLYKIDQLAPCALRAGVNLAERLPKECYTFQSRLSFALAVSKLHPYRKQRESPIPVRETQSAIHPNAQRNAFRRPGARPQSRLPGVRTDGSKCQGPCQLHRVAAESLLIVG